MKLCSLSLQRPPSLIWMFDIFSLFIPLNTKQQLVENKMKIGKLKAISTETRTQ